MDNSALPRSRKYCTSVNPSLCRSSSATYWGAIQMPGILINLIVVVSGGGSAATGLGRRPRSPAVPASVNPSRNLRRLNRLAYWVLMGTSLPDTGQCDTENAGQWTLLPSHEQAQHLTPGVRRVRLRTSPARPCWATVLSLSTPEWIDSQLHEPSDRLCCAPMFHHTAAGNAIQIDTAPCAVLSRWFAAAPFAQVSPFSGHPKGNPIAFGHDLRGTTREIWKQWYGWRAGEPPQLTAPSVRRWDCCDPQMMHRCRVGSLRTDPRPQRVGSTQALKPYSRRGSFQHRSTPSTTRCSSDAQRWASAAAGSGSGADAVGSQLHAFVRLDRPPLAADTVVVLPAACPTAPSPFLCATPIGSPHSPGRGVSGGW